MSQELSGLRHVGHNLRAAASTNLFRVSRYLKDMAPDPIYHENILIETWASHGSPDNMRLRTSKGHWDSSTPSWSKCLDSSFRIVEPESHKCRHRLDCRSVYGKNDVAEAVETTVADAASG